MALQGFWHLSRLPVPAERVSLAMNCEQMGRHRAGLNFGESLEGMGTQRSEWDWRNSVRDRGMHRIEKARRTEGTEEKGKGKKADEPP